MSIIQIILHHSNKHMEETNFQYIYEKQDNALREGYV